MVNAAAIAGGAVMGATPEAGGPAWASRAALAVALLAGLRLVRWLLIAAPHGHGAAWLARWSRWEFWPMWLFYAPVAAWVALLSLRYRGLSTITASNPGIEDGGVVGESKFGILSKLPADAIIPSAMVPMGALEGLTIVELNGATAESTDIYDPAGTLIAAYRTLFRQWAIVFAIGSANRATGAPVSSLRRLASLVRTHLTSRPAFVLSD